MFAPKVFDMNKVLNLPIHQLVLWLNDTATLLEAHHYHGPNWSAWVPGSVRFRQHAVELTAGEEAAKNKDREKMRALEEMHAEALMSINMNATYIVMKSVYEKDESLLHNVGYPLKDQHSKKEKPTLKSSLGLRLKNGPEEGSVWVYYDKDPAAALYHLQICKGEPSGEGSWQDDGLHKGCRQLRKNLERASWHYFRVRAHGDNETGPWSVPVGIVVT